MHRFRHGLLLLVLAALAPLLPALPVAAQSQSVEQLRALWVDSLNPGFFNHPEVDELVANAVRGGFNTIFIQVRRHGDAWYNRSRDPRAADPRLAPAEAFDPLAYTIEKAHSAGLRVHAWLVVSVTCRRTDRLWGHPQHVCTSHGPDAQGAERWTTATFDGQQIGDLDYGHPSAITYFEQVVQDLLYNYPGLDGVHWDYIRYSGASYGYNQVSLERFNRAYGLPLANRPRPDDPAWSQWRRDRVTELARRLYIRVKAINPRVQVSAATIAWGGVGSYGPADWTNSAAYSRVFQDWRRWLEEGILDFAVPMYYFAERNNQQRGWYDSWVTWGRSNSGRRAIVAGIGSWLNSPEQNMLQVQRALAADERGWALAGVAFFSYNQVYSNSSAEGRRAFMDQLRATVFAQPARSPDWHWLAYPTAGHLQGIATVDGQVAPEAKVSLVKDGVWLRDIFAAADGWFGAVDLPPGAYTIVITRGDGRQSVQQAPVRPGAVTSF